MKKSDCEQELSAAEQGGLLKVLEARFAKNMKRHPGVEWKKVEARLEANPQKLWSLHQMEETGGQPDVTGQDAKTGELVFSDCAPETPKGRTSLCYDAAALEARKEHKPEGSAVGMAASMGIELLSEEEYFELQKHGPFDAKTSSWLKTPAEIRKLGGGLFADHRYGRTFVSHNGVQSYFAGRGFRGSLRV